MVELRSFVARLAMSLALAGSLVSCGGGGGTGGGGGGPATAEELTFEQRQVVFDGFRAAVASVDATDGAAMAAAADAYLATRTEIAQHGIVDGTSVWARFKDGRWLSTHFNRLPSSASTPVVAMARQTERARAATEQPAATPARYLNMFGEWNNPDLNPPFKTPIVEMAQVAAGHGYTSRTPIESPGTLDDIKALGDAAIVYIDSHGGRRPDPTSLSGYVGDLITSTEISAMTDAAYRDDLQTGRLLYSPGMQMNHGTFDVYSVSPAWIREHVSIGKGALIVLNACNLGAADLDMAQALVDKGADAVYGWSLAVENSSAFAVARFLFDRLLGNNAVEPVAADEPRPLDFAETLQAALTTTNPSPPPPGLPKRFPQTVSYGTSYYTGASLTLTTPTNRTLTSGSLLPIIRSSSVDLDAMTATLTGVFGSLTGEVFEAIGAGSATPGRPLVSPQWLSTWSPTTLTVSIFPDTKRVMLRANGRLSNAVTLDVCNVAPAAAPAGRQTALAAPTQCKPPEFTLALAPASGTELPTDKSLGLTAVFKSTLPKGATVEWSWSHSGVGSLTPLPADANPADSVATFNTGAAEGNATITARAQVTIPATDTTPSRTVAAAPATTTLVVKKALTTLTLTSGWMYEVTWGEPYTFFGCGTEANPVGLCRPYEIIFYAVIPKVAGAKATSMTLNRATPDPLNAIAFPSTFTAASGHWIDRGGYWVQGLSSVGGTAGENGVQPGSHIASETARFGPMTVTVNVTP